MQDHVWSVHMSPQSVYSLREHSSQTVSWSQAFYLAFISEPRFEQCLLDPSHWSSMVARAVSSFRSRHGPLCSEPHFLSLSFCLHTQTIYFNLTKRCFLCFLSITSSDFFGKFSKTNAAIPVAATRDLLITNYLLDYRLCVQLFFIKSWK